MANIKLFSMIFFLVVGMTMAMAATVDVSISTPADSYSVGDIVPVTVTMNSNGASVKDSTFVVEVANGVVVENSGQKLAFFNTYGTGSSNQKVSDTEWKFYSGVNTPSATAFAAVFSFNVEATTEGNLLLNIKTDDSSVLEMKGPPPTFTDVYHEITPLDKTVSVVTAQLCTPGVTESCTTSDNYLGQRSCSADGTEYSDCVPTEFCGDGVANGNEECDGLDLNGNSCPNGGTMTCNANCMGVDMSQCTSSDACTLHSDCPADAACDLQNGVCVVCVDSDGNDGHTLGTITGVKETGELLEGKLDECLQGTYVAENTCTLQNGNTFATYVAKSGAGLVCENGVFVADTSTQGDETLGEQIDSVVDAHTGAKDLSLLAELAAIIKAWFASS